MQAGVGPTSLFTHWRTVAVPGAVQFFTRLTGEKKKIKVNPLQRLMVRHACYKTNTVFKRTRSNKY